MIIAVEPFRNFHLDLLRAQGVQEAQVREVSHVPGGYASLARAPGPALTARDGDRIIACGGILVHGDGLGTLWAVLAGSASGHLLFLHRATIRFMDTEPLRRLEATVQEGFQAGCRWLDLLGFHYEGPMLGYGLDGATHLRYARVRR